MAVTKPKRFSDLEDLNFVRYDRKVAWGKLNEKLRVDHVGKVFLEDQDRDDVIRCLREIFDVPVIAIREDVLEGLKKEDLPYKPENKKKDISPKKWVGNKNLKISENAVILLDRLTSVPLGKELPQPRAKIKEIKGKKPSGSNLK